MLRINLKSNISNELSEIHIEDMLFSQDFKVVTCVAEDDGNLQRHDKIKLYSSSYEDWMEIDVDVERFTAVGEFWADTKYQVYSDRDSDCKYIRFHDNRYYYNNAETEGSEIMVDGIGYPIQQSEIDGSDCVVIKERYLITSLTQTLYDGRECEIFLEREIGDDGEITTRGSFVVINEEPEVIINNEDLNVFNSPKTFVRITFQNDGDIDLGVEKVSCTNFVNYVTYYDTDYDLDEKLDGSSTFYVTIGEGLSGLAVPYSYEYNSENGKFVYTELDAETVDYAASDTYASGITTMIKVNDAEHTYLPIQRKLKDSDIGGMVSIYLEHKNVDIDTTDRIIAKTIGNIPRYSLAIRRTKIVDGEPEIVESIVHNAKYYDKLSVDLKGNPFYYVTIGGKEYEFHYVVDSEGNTDNIGYIDYEGTVMYLKTGSSISSVVSEYNSQKPSTDNSRFKIEFANETLIGLSGIPYETHRIEVICNNVSERKYNIDTYYDGSSHVFAYVPYENLLTRKLYGDANGEEIIISDPIYAISRYDIVEIDGDKYKVQTNRHIYGDNQYDNDEIVQFIMFDKPEAYLFEILEIQGSNRLICRPIVDDYQDYETDTMQEYREMISGICYDVATNYDTYHFLIEGRFSPYKEEIDFSRYNSLDNNQPLNLKNLHFYKYIDYITVPFVASQDCYANLFQEDNLGNQFVKTEIIKSINEYVDMDKDVYYPYYVNGNDKKEINGIYFNLHFRTRTLDGWTINEDYTKINGNDKDETLLPSLNEANTNWFCFDYYSGNTNYAGYNDNGTTYNQTYGEYDIYKNPEEAWKHSDLLYFLNFTNNDVFYQKKKLSNSFLRLMFYDSKNPANQSLLYQATIWYDSSKAYKKYIDNNESNEYFDFNNNATRVGIGVSCEPYSATTPNASAFTFDDNIRLDSQFYVKNRYQMEDSAEGFYLHLFKDLLDGVCARTIYMKIVFNHAGEGKSCLFMLPHSKQGDTIVPWEYTQENVEELKNGISLEKALESIYIPINVEYDLEKDKYIYYLSENAAVLDSDNNLTFNLFEIKMKDESNSQENNP